MDHMIRKQIYIQRRQQALLKRAAKQRGVSEAEIIRRALDRELAAKAFPVARRDQDAFAQAYRFMVARRALGVSAPAYRWRREDAYQERMSRYERTSRK